MNNDNQDTIWNARIQLKTITMDLCNGLSQRATTRNQSRLEERNMLSDHLQILTSNPQSKQLFIIV